MTRCQRPLLQHHPDHGGLDAPERRLHRARQRGVSGDASLTGDGVLLYFTCPYDPDPRYVDTCDDPPGDADGGVLDVSTSGNVSLTAYEAGSAQNPDDLLVYFDPLEDAVLDDLPRPRAMTTPFSASTATARQPGRSVYAEAGQVDLGGDTRIGSTSESSEEGDLVTSLLDSSGALQVDGIPPSIGYCWVYDDKVSVTSGATTSTGQVWSKAIARVRSRPASSASPMAHERDHGNAPLARPSNPKISFTRRQSWYLETSGDASPPQRRGRLHPHRAAGGDRDPFGAGGDRHHQRHRRQGHRSDRIVQVRHRSGSDGGWTDTTSLTACIQTRPRVT